MKKKIKLPADEVRFLSSLPIEIFHGRLRALWESGWSLGIIANSLDPKRPKSTVHFWVQNAASQEQRRPIPATPPKSLTVTAPLSNTPRLRSISPSVPVDMRPHLQHLSSLAKRYRAKSDPHSEFAIANRELTDLARSLYNRGVPAADIAEAAGVTYRAMARRLSNG
jgi:hypothetical protein